MHAHRTIENDLSFLSPDDQAHFRVVVEAHRSKNVVLFCGAGFSFNAPRIDGSENRLPSWKQLAEALAKDLPGVCPSESPLDIAELYETTYGRHRLLARMWQLIEDRRYFPGQLHRLIPLLDFKEVITTNYDTLIERAFLEEQIVPRIVVSDSDLVSSTGPRVIKINGCCDRNRDGVVVTREDFRRYDAEHPLFQTFLTGCFVESLVLFVGFGLNDPAFQKIFGRVRDILGRDGRMAYSIQKEYPRKQADFWLRRGVRIIDLWSGDSQDCLDYQDRLYRLMETLLHESYKSVGSDPTEAKHDRLFKGLLNLRSEIYPEGVEPADENRGFLERRFRAPGHDPSISFLEALLPPSTLDELARFEADLGAPPKTFSVKNEIRTLRTALGAFLARGSKCFEPFIELLFEVLCIGHPQDFCHIEVFQDRRYRVVLKELARVLFAALETRPVPAELPVLLNQLVLFLSMYEPKPKLYGSLLDTIRCLDARCLLVRSATLQRDALMQISLLASGRRIREIFHVLDETIDETVLEAISRNEKHWVLPPYASGEAKVASLAPESLERLRQDLLTRVDQLPNDMVFRLRLYLRGRFKSAEYRQALDWIRQRTDLNSPAAGETIQSNLVTRYLALYACSSRSEFREIFRTPFYERVANQFRAMEESLRERSSEEDNQISLPGQVHRMVSRFFRGYSITSDQLEDFWKQAMDTLRDASSEIEILRCKVSVPWSHLIHLSLIDQLQPSFIDPVITELAERDLIDLDFLLDFWKSRFQERGFAGMDRTESSRLTQSLETLSSFLLNITRSRPVWQDRRVVDRLLEVAAELLHGYRKDPVIRQNVLQILAHLSRHGPCFSVLKTIKTWIEAAVARPDHRSLGLAWFDWRRLLSEHPEALDDLIDEDIARQVLEWGFSYHVRDIDVGRDIQSWALTLFRLHHDDRGAKEFRLKEEMRNLVVHHFSDQLRIEADSGSFSWLYRAEELRQADLVPLADVILGDDRQSASADPLTRFVIERFQEIQSDWKVGSEWRLRQNEYLLRIAVFLDPKLGKEVLDEETVSFLVSATAPLCPTEDSSDAAETIPMPKARWPMARLHVVCGFLCHLRASGHPYALAHHEEIDREIVELVFLGATGQGEVGRVANVLSEDALARLQSNYARAVVHMRDQVRADKVEEAARCLQRAEEVGVRLEALEETLIHLAGGLDRSTRDAACRWLLRELESRKRSEPVEKWQRERLLTLQDILKEAPFSWQAPPRLLRAAVDKWLSDWHND